MVEPDNRKLRTLKRYIRVIIDQEDDAGKKLGGKVLLEAIENLLGAILVGRSVEGRIKYSLY